MLDKIGSVKFEDHQISRFAFVFVLFVFAFETYKLNINYSEYLIYLYDSQGVFFGLVSVFVIIVSLLVFYKFTVSAFGAQTGYKVLYFLLFLPAVFIEFGYQKALGRFSIPADVETAAATTAEQQMASISLYLNPAAIVPCALLLVCLLLIKSKNPRGLKSFLLTFCVFGTNFVALSTFGGIFIENKFPTLSLNAFCRTSVDFLIRGSLDSGSLISLENGPKKRRAVKQPSFSESFRPSNNVVLVIDESVRGDHLSLNGYRRQTTPFLDRLKARGILHNWGIAAAASTGSRYSYNALMTGLKPEAFPDKTGIKIHTFPTLFQYAKAMNYKTHYFDGQMKNYWGGVEDDKNYIDFLYNVSRFDEAGAAPKWEIDNRLAATVNEVISGSAGNFIVVFKRGSHIPYQDNFPAEQALWMPSYSTKNKYDIPASEQLPEVVNAYDNAISYNVNSFFRNLIEDYDRIPNETKIIYTGDHGQTLFANGKASHGGMTPGEANVPLFIIGALESPPDVSYKASHQNIFPTILDFLGYPEELREAEKSISLLKASAKDSRPRFFNPDLDVRVSFE